MTGNKEIAVIFLVTICCGISHGIPLDGDIALASPNYGVSESEIAPVEKSLMEKSTSTAPSALQKILDDITPRYGSYQDWLMSIARVARDLLKQLAGFAPYVAKLAAPIIKSIRLVLETGRSYIVEYVRNMPPETAQNIQLTIIELFKKLINMNLVRAVIRMFLRAIL